jgi:hypothetical protein
LRSVSCSQSSCLQEDSKEHRKEKKKNFFRSNSTCALQTLDEEKSKHVDLGQQNGFGPTFLHMMLRLAKCMAKTKDQHMLFLIC